MDPRPRLRSPQTGDMSGQPFVLRRPVAGARLAEAVGLRWHGDERPVTAVAPLSAAGDGTLVFASLPPASPLPAGSIAIAIAPLTPCGMVAANPRLAFVRTLSWLQAEIGFVLDEAPPALAAGVIVGEGSILGRGVVAGAGTRIGHNVTIADRVRIGAGCVVKSGAVIGEDGFGLERDERGEPLRFPHLGGVVIGNRVEIGSRATVCRGALGDTVIGDGVKVDDGAHVAHNCRVGEGALIHAGAVLSGGVKVGPLAWIGPGATVIQHVTIGERAMIGIGANVIRDVEAGTTVAGNPARPLRPR